ncbi:leucine-rich repeat domain-containing protein [Formosa sp. PL04]|uniref:leucine-rich repeat domain-containing protein n=1 Tax=Formosa sp. PL04 TaxID=3081755 RepID=UPI002981BFE7|nr:leucine-rich repeat domain-containing protein [Formosa sp. PL04]MDW5290803.1 leucine-rich repeat domain-containing protein [Formosa sp. PL04]
MKHETRELDNYFQKMISALAESSNMWIIEHPEIVERLNIWDWQSDLKKTERKVLDLYIQSNFNFNIGTIAISWDSYYNLGATIYFAPTNEYQEWKSEDWLDFDIDLSDIINPIFLGIEDWSTELGDELELFSNLFSGIIAYAFINSFESSAFKKLNKTEQYILLSATCEDSEFSLIHNAEEPESYDLYFPINTPPVTASDGHGVLFGQAYSYDTKHISSNQTRLGFVPDSIGSFQQVEELDLSHGYLKNLPITIFLLPKLITLNLKANKLKTINVWLDKLLNLTNLDISNNLLTELPNTLCSLSKLKQLHLEYNKLITIPKGMEVMKTLEFLNLNSNTLVELPKLPENLTWLNLYNNQLKSLPESFKNLKNLETLVLSKNAFSSVPKEIFKLTSLKSIELGDNIIEDLPDELLSMPNLKQIRVFPNIFSIEKRKILREKYGERLFVGYDTSESSFMKRV